MKKPFVWKKRGSLGEYTEFHLAWLELGVYISLNLSYADLFFSLSPPPCVSLSSLCKTGAIIIDILQYLKHREVV